MTSFSVKPLSAAIGLLLLGSLPYGLAQATSTENTPAESTAVQTLVVTAAGFEQNVTDAPASISVITREELERRSYINVIDAVRHIPGVFITGGGNNQDISLRGMASSYTLVLVDGRPISAGRQTNTNGTDGGKQSLALPPLAMIDRIEVIRGPMSSLYGSDAMGGVINIITRRDQADWQGTLRTEYTLSLNDVSNDASHTEFYLSGALVPNLLQLQLNGAYTGIDESDFQTSGSFKSDASQPQTRRKNGGFELALTPSQQDRIALGYRYATQESTHTEGRSTSAATSTGRFDRQTWTLTHDGRYGNLLLSSYLQQDVAERVQEQTMEETTRIANTQGTYFWGAHTLTFGGQYKEEDFTNGQNVLYNAGIQGGVHSADRWLAAIFAEAEWAVTDDLSLTTGLRYNDDEFFGGHLSPRLYSVYRLNPSWTLKGGVSTGYRQPSLTQATEGFGGRTGGGGSPNTTADGRPLPRALMLGNPNLDPETSINYEAGVIYHDPSLGLNFSLMAFHTQFDDKIISDRFCSSPDAANNNDTANYACEFGGNTYWFLQRSVNVGEAQMQGIELTVDYQFTDSLHLSANYTWTETEQRSGEFRGEPLNKQPEHMLNALVDWQTSDRLNLWLQGSYRSSTSDYLGRFGMIDGTPGYGFIDLGLNYQLTDQVSVQSGLYNLADKEVTDSDYEVVLDGRRLQVGLTAHF